MFSKFGFAHMKFNEYGFYSLVIFTWNVSMNLQAVTSFFKMVGGQYRRIREVSRIIFTRIVFMVDTILRLHFPISRVNFAHKLKYRRKHERYKA